MFPTKQNPQQEFWHDTSRYGVIHYSAGENQHKDSSVCLLIFVHGLFGDAIATWGKMPDWVLENANLDMDVVSFSYPSKIWQRTSISQAAYDLKTWLETEFSEHRHLIFVTHSTGGLIVKQLLHQAYQSIQTTTTESFLSSSLWWKTRHVINIAVPHTGGSPFLTTLTSVLYHLLYPFLAPILRLVRSLSQGKKDWGWNSIVPALRWKNRWLLKLDDQFRSSLQQSLDFHFPTPITADIFAESDQSVPQSVDNSTHKIHIRGTHKSIKIPRRSTGPMVGIVAKVIRRYPQDISLTVVDRTLIRVVEVNNAAGIDSLIDTSGLDEQSNNGTPMPTTAARCFGNQNDVCKLVTDRVKLASDSPVRIVVTGAGGVGKSTVMRMITWRLGCEYLASPRSNPIPLFIPLQQVTVTDISEKTYTWENLWAWWLHWAQTLFPAETGTMEWLEEKFETNPVVILLDGLDDFLVNHPTIGLSTIVNLLRQAVAKYSANRTFSIIISIRNDVNGLERLADDPSAIYEILPLSRLQAIETFPQSKEWVSSVQNVKLLEQILTPLVLTNYQPPVGQSLGSYPLTQTSILNQIVETFLRNSHLVGTRLSQNTAVELHHLFIALAIIAWLFFSKSRGEIHLDVLHKEAQQLRKRWESFFFANPTSDGNDDFVTGCKLVEKVEICELLVKNTVFLSTGPESFRFAHRHWQELLLARFFLSCIRYNYFDDFGSAKLYSGIFRMAGEMYQGSAITAGQVESVIDTWRQTENTFVTSNFIGFLSWTITPIDAQAIHLLVGELENFRDLSRVILIGGLGYRLLVNDKNDYSLDDIRRCLFPKFIEYSNPETCPMDAPIVSSLAWCYQKAFAELFDIPEPMIAWPALHFDDYLTLKVLPMVASVKHKGFSLSDQSRSLQQALLTPILDTYQHPQFVIRAVHYIYILVIAEKHGVHAFAVSQELPSLLAAGSKFEQLVKAFSLVPEVLELYKRCQQLHAKLASAKL